MCAGMYSVYIFPFASKNAKCDDDGSFYCSISTELHSYCFFEPVCETMDSRKLNFSLSEIDHIIGAYWGLDPGQVSYNHISVERFWKPYAFGNLEGRLQKYKGG